MLPKDGVKPFEVQTITKERIFIDKLFAAEAYVRKSDESHHAFEAAKHIYDLTVLYSDISIQTLLCDAEQMEKLLLIRVTEEIERRDGIPGVIPRDLHFLMTQQIILK